MTDYEHNTPSLNQAAGAAEKGGLLLPPPTNICNSVSYKHLQPSVVFRTLLHTATARVGRVCCIVLAAAALLALASCGKEENLPNNSLYSIKVISDPSPYCFNIIVDTAWEDDTTICFQASNRTAVEYRSMENNTLIRAKRVRQRNGIYLKIY